MTHDTIEMTPVDTVRLTATLRPARDLPTGEFQLHTGKCVVELAICVLGRPLVRGRIEAGGGTLAVGELSTLELDLLPDSMRVPFVGARLLAGLDEPLALRARSVHTDDETVVLAVTGPLATRWSRVTLAAEFVR
jgi:hypothetical protein